MATFTLSALYEKAFGVPRGNAFNADAIRRYDGQEDASNSFGFPDASLGGEAENEFVTVRKSILGNNYNGQQLFMPIKIGGLILPNEPTLTITGRKTIVETALVGSTRRGTVKELISVEDYQLTVRGICINVHQSQYPEDQVKGIHDLFLQNVAHKIQCGLTSLLGIYRVVVKEISFPEMIGVQHAQAYQLTMVSDEDFILELDERQ
jgi:Domain of unknown function (DUF6046)